MIKKTYFVLTEFRVEIYFGGTCPDKTWQGLMVCGWKYNRYKKCLYNRKTEENIKMAETVCKEMNGEQDPLKELPKYEIELSDLVVRSNGFYCDKHHNVEDIAGVISCLDKKGNWWKKTVPLVLCHDCSTYFILEETYKDLKKSGIIGCQILKKVDYDKGRTEKIDTSDWDDESLLKRCGYSVSKADGLSDEQRQGILIEIIKQKLMTKNRVLSYLDFFRRIGTREDSKELWKMDRDYVANYNTERKSVSVRVR